MEKINSISIEERSKFKLPPGAKVTKSSKSINVEKIKNGYLLNVSYDLQYTTADGRNDYAYYTEKTFSEENPVKIVDIPKTPKHVVDDMD